HVVVIGRKRAVRVRESHFSQRRGRRVVINPALGIHDVKRLSQVALGEQVTSQTPDVRDLQRHAVWQFAANREIESVSVRSLHRLIDSPGNRLAVWRRIQRRRRRLKKYLVGRITAVIDRAASGNLVDVSYAGDVGGIVIAKSAASVLYRCTYSAGRVRVEGVEQLHSSAIVDLA